MSRSSRFMPGLAHDLGRMIPKLQSAAAAGNAVNGYPFRACWSSSAMQTLPLRHLESFKERVEIPKTSARSLEGALPAGPILRIPPKSDIRHVGKIGHPEMSYVTKILRPDEHLLVIGRLHWIIYKDAV